MEKTKLQWHPGFSAALKMTLESEKECLEIHEEFRLSKKLLQIDILIVKKLKETTIKKSIIYQSDTDRVKEVDPETLTLTFVCNHYPREMLKHLKQVRGIHVEKHGPGICYLKGDPIPMQLLIVKELSKAENYWLQILRTDLKAGPEIRELMTNYEKNKKSKDCVAVMNLIARANWKQMEVEKKMCDALKELFADELKEADERGREQLLAEQVEKKLQKKKSISEIADELETDEQTIRMIIGKIG